eukprot:TRINITY_DN23885_c0_g1_i1.p1 TRINITY_DN23885_c0_g1~~TRINITY_DN23885_c0_g1_i1.p1  ORF type:complete len:776 (-),score=117.30 TRINITY_DN23885_c0_g1_i1:30-2357(-)
MGKDGEDRPLRTFECAVLGHPLAHTSQLLQTIATGTFPVGRVEQPYTEGVVQSVHVDGNHLALRLVDCVSVDKLPSAEVYILCFSPCHPETFQAVVQDWYPRLVHINAMLLVATRTELMHEERSRKKMVEKGVEPTPHSAVVEWQQKVRLQHYLEVSAKLGIGMSELLENATRLGVEASGVKLKQKGHLRKKRLSNTGLDSPQKIDDIRRRIKERATAPDRGEDSSASSAAGDSGRRQPGLSRSSGPDDPWREVTTPDGRTYYYNKITKQTRWRKPTDVEAELATQWKEARTPDGRIYYYNPSTRETRWTKPEEASPTSSPRAATAAQPPALQGTAQPRTTTAPELPPDEVERQISGMVRVLKEKLSGYVEHKSALQSNVLENKSKIQPLSHAQQKAVARIASVKAGHEALFGEIQQLETLEENITGQRAATVERLDGLQRSIRQWLDMSLEAAERSDGKISQIPTDPPAVDNHTTLRMQQLVLEMQHMDAKFLSRKAVALEQIAAWRSESDRLTECCKHLAQHLEETEKDVLSSRQLHGSKKESLSQAEALNTELRQRVSALHAARGLLREKSPVRLEAVKAQLADSTPQSTPLTPRKLISVNSTTPRTARDMELLRLEGQLLRTEKMRLEQSVVALRSELTEQRVHLAALVERRLQLANRTVELVRGRDTLLCGVAVLPRSGGTTAPLPKPQTVSRERGHLAEVLLYHRGEAAAAVEFLRKVDCLLAKPSSLAPGLSPTFQATSPPQTRSVSSNEDIAYGTLVRRLRKEYGVG